MKKIIFTTIGMLVLFFLSFIIFYFSFSSKSLAV